MTIGDLWVAGNFQLSFEHRKGVSVVLLNNKKGRALFQDVLSESDFEVNYNANKKTMNMDENLVKPGFIDWLAYFQHASYVITDSMHGACFSVLYRKKFVAIKSRSKERFDSLAKLTECPDLFFEDAASLLGKTDIFADIDYDTIYSHIESKRIKSREWLRSALDREIKPKSSSESTEMMLRLYRSLREKTDLLNEIKVRYAYEEEQREEIAAQQKAGKTWFDIVSLKNNKIPERSELRETEKLQDYFKMLRADPSRYVIVMSGRDECSTHRKRFLEVIGLPLQADVPWRDSYVAVIDDGTVRIDESSKEELRTEYEFVAGHPNYSVEYLDHKLKVCCAPLRYCRIRIKSRGFNGSPGRDKSEILVDNIDYSINKIGINMVVIDKETGEVVDSININTYSDAGLKINRA